MHIIISGPAEFFLKGSKKSRLRDEPRFLKKTLKTSFNSES